MRERLISRWGRWRRLSDVEAHQAAEQWRAALGVRQPVTLSRIARHQVMDASSGQRGCSLVGVVFDESTACIYHTRALMAEDIVHELLHVAYPAWPEHDVVRRTAEVLQSDGADRDRGVSAPAVELPAVPPAQA
jgi:hypothetical protein